ncbi:S8 family serine peptidase [Virgibacillus halodenitrificans]|uniref:S8 family serine peptidase n=1 Tax=Virgibacillus halodenitrificans TaxID=1482 RepID=UPI001EEE9055|nr:S8 family serine peptidase [Virgibacillus halodenitrificans]
MKKKLFLSPLFILLIVYCLVTPIHSYAESTGDGNSAPFKNAKQEHHSYKKNRTSKSLEQAEGNIPKAKVNNRRILVKIKEGHEFRPVDFGLTEIHTSNLLREKGLTVVEVSPRDDFYRKLKQLQHNTNIENAEPDYTGELEYIPTDTGFPSQWYLNKIGMPRVWDAEQGSQEVTIAVLDSGVERNHPDLKGRILPGYDFVNNDYNPADDHGHGTHVAGIIAANANTFGIIGMDFNAKILPVKVANEEGDITSQNLIEGIYYAIENGADIINMSLGSYQPSELEEEAILAAHEAGVILVAAAGNDSLGEPSYPASYRGVISVAATGKQDEQAGFSNFGNFIDLSAPGIDIVSTNNRKEYSSGNGTSFSTPIVSGMTALLKSAHPTWNKSEIEWVMEASADSLSGKTWDDTYGYGRINGFTAINKKLPNWSSNVPNEREVAKKIISGVKEKDKIDFPMDIDWYQLNIAEDGVLNGTIEDESSMLDLVVMMTDPKGKLQFIDHGDRGEGEKFRLRLEKGTYYFGIFDYYDHWSTSNYHIQLDSLIEDEDKSIVFEDVRLYKTEIYDLVDRGVIRGYPDSTFRPEQNVSRLQAVQMILLALGVNLENYQAPNPGFADVHPGSYGYKAIAAAADIGFIKGKDNNTFDAKGSLTRAQMAAILVKAFQLEGKSNTSFTDVPKNHWAYEVINNIVANDIARGYSDNTYRPKQPVSRQHFAVFLYNTK